MWNVDTSKMADLFIYPEQVNTVSVYQWYIYAHKWLCFSFKSNFANFEVDILVCNIIRRLKIKLQVLNESGLRFSGLLVEYRHCALLEKLINSQNSGYYSKPLAFVSSKFCAKWTQMWLIAFSFLGPVMVCWILISSLHFHTNFDQLSSHPTPFHYPSSSIFVT